MKKEWKKLKTAVNLAAAMEVGAFTFYIHVFFSSWFLFYNLGHHPHHHNNHHQNHHPHQGDHHNHNNHHQGDKEESDEDEEIYAIDPKPEPKFRQQIFRDKERVILYITLVSTNRSSLIS